MFLGCSWGVLSVLGVFSLLETTTEKQLYMHLGGQSRPFCENWNLLGRAEDV